VLHEAQNSKNFFPNEKIVPKSRTGNAIEKKQQLLRENSNSESVFWHKNEYLSEEEYWTQKKEKCDGWNHIVRMGGGKGRSIVSKLGKSNEEEKIRHLRDK